MDAAQTPQLWRNRHVQLPQLLDLSRFLGDASPKKEVIKREQAA
tara:strand:+ start:235 stop:366 length:132 start_codon:yes stop_codon:yes gene_type:complete